MNVPVHKFNYEDVYNGKTLIIGHEVIFNIIINVNPELNFHISNNRQYGLQFGLLYSKSIDKDLQYRLDLASMAIFESGIAEESIFETRNHNKRINIRENDTFEQKISIDFIEKRILFFAYYFAFLLVLISIEIIISKFCFIISYF